MGKPFIRIRGFKDSSAQVFSSAFHLNPEDASNFSRDETFFMVRNIEESGLCVNKVSPASGVRSCILA